MRPLHKVSIMHLSQRRDLQTGRMKAFQVGQARGGQVAAA